MGIYDREYYRDETSGSGWLTGLAPACKTIILINVAVYLAEVIFPNAGLEKYFAAYSDLVFPKFQIWRLATAPFLHDPHSPFHLIFNMVLLWIAGREIEAMHGGREFTAFYMTGAVVSSLGWAVIEQFLPGAGLHIPMMGASGAVAAVVTLYTLYNPRREILFLFIVPVEMWLLLVIYLGTDFVFLMQQFHGGSSMGVAFAAHLVGAAYGYVYKTWDLRWSRLISLKPRRRRPRLRVVKSDLYDREMDVPLSSGSGKTVSPSPASRPSPSTAVAEEQLDARLDEILAKIAREGRAGLTEEENRILQEASRRARDRRGDRVR